jgi:hypothetical protein
VISVAFVVAFGATILRGGVRVSVNNSTSGTISNVVLRFTGGSKGFVHLKPKRTASTRVNPNSESHLVLEYRDTVGALHSTNIDTYFEHGYRGSIAITIEEGGTVTWKDNVKPRLF